jgi:uncharacterized membrane protein YhaH (DUF805 family)
MPVSTCALYWSAILEHRPSGALLALAAFALNGLLMLGCLHYYRGVLQRHALTLGETAGGLREAYESMYVLPGRTSRNQFISALLVLLLAVVFYKYLVTGRTAQWCIAVLLLPGTMLMARRLRDMGRSGWPLVVPVALMLAAFAAWLGNTSLGAQATATLPPLALVAAAGLAIWGCAGRSGQLA